MRVFRILSAAIVIAITALAPSAGAFPTVRGGEGGVITQSAEVIPPMSLDISLFGQYVNYYGDPTVGSGKGESEKQSPLTELSASANLGVAQFLQLGLIAPFILSGGQGGAGLGQATFVAKSAFFPSDRQGFNVGLTVDLKAPVTNQNLGSGQMSYGGEANLSYWTPWAISPSFHLNLGYGRRDYYLNYWDPDEQKILYWHSTPTIFGSAAARLAISSHFEMSAEVVGESYRINTIGLNDDSDENLYGALGARVILGDQVALTGALASGLPDARKANTDLLMIAGASLLFLPPEMMTTGPSETPSAVDDYVSAEDSQKAAELEGLRKKPLKTLRIKIIAGCNNGKKAKFLAKKMISAGFNVTEISGVRGKYNLSRIVFTEPFSRQAVTLARILPGKQKINRSSKKIPNADLVVIVGCDFMKKSAPTDTAPPRPLGEAQISIVDACGNIENAKTAARVMIMDGITNIAGIDSAPVADSRKYSVIQFKPGFLQAAGKIGDLLPGRQKIEPQKDPTKSDLTILCGCAGF